MQWRAGLGLVVLLLAQTAARTAQSPNESPSKYAPVAGLTEQLKDHMERLEKDLKSADDYGDEQKARVAMDANTMGAIALVLGMHDQPTPYNGKVSEIIEQARELGDASLDHTAAVIALGRLQKAVKPEHSGTSVKWGPVADVSEMMKAVPNVNNALRRGVTSRRFERSQQRTVSYAAVLAALAQASLFDDAYCGDEEDVKVWRQLCAEMRDASGETGRAVAAGDQERAKQAMERIVTTCDKCHELFR